MSIALNIETAEIVRQRADMHATWLRCRQSFGRYFAVRVGNDMHLVDDLMQQLWLQASRKADSCRDEDPEPWMWCIARNLFREHYRRLTASWDRRFGADARLAKELADRIDREELPEAVLAREEVCQQLRLALTAMAASDQELLIGIYFQEKSHAQVARTLGISDRAIEGRLYRARKALRDRLEHLQMEFDL